MQHAFAPVCKRLFCSVFLAWLCLFCKELTAQQQYAGYLISTSGDTTWGTVITGKSIYHNQRRVRFIDELGMQVHYDAELLAGYGFGDSVYVSRTRPADFKKVFERDSVFMARVVSGPATLFRYFPPKQETPLYGGVDYVEFLHMPDGSAYELMPPHYRDRLLLAFLGMPKWTEQINRFNFRREKLAPLLNRFNQQYKPRKTQARRGN